MRLMCCTRALGATFPATDRISYVPLCACAQTAGDGATQTSMGNVADSIGLGIATPTPITVPTVLPALGRRRRRKL